MQRELTLVEHESKFSEVVADIVKTAAMKAMLPKDILERFVDGPFHCEELRNRVSAYVGEKLAGQDASGGAQPMDIGQIDKSEGEDEDVNAVQQRRPFDRPNQKHKQESDNERKPFNRRTANSSPSASRQSTPRDKKSGSDQTKQSAGKKKRLICFKCGGKGHLPDSAHQQMIAKTWMKSEQSRPVMLTVICLVWIGAMTPQRPRTQRPNGTTELVVEGVAGICRFWRS